MAKKKSDTISNEDFEAELQSAVPVLDCPLIGIAKNAAGGFNIVRVKIDAKTLDVGEVEVLESADSKFEANEKFKINVVKQGIL